VFRPSVDQNGKKIIKEYEPKFPRDPSAKIIGAFVRYSTPMGSDLRIMDIQDVARLAAASARRNKGKANELYTSNNGQIDTGFFETKCIKFAMKATGKVRLGAFTKLDGEDEIEQDVNIETDEITAAQAAPVTYAAPVASPQITDDNPY